MRKKGCDDGDARKEQEEKGRGLRERRESL